MRKTLTRTNSQEQKETRVAKRIKHAPEGNNRVGYGSPTDTGNVPLVPSQSALLSRSGSIRTGLVPVVDANQRPLMPCKQGKIRKLIKSGKVTPFFKKGIFAVRLNKVVKPTNSRVIVAIDPGSKRTGITVATEKDVVLNVQCNTPNWVKEKIEDRRTNRRTRRQRKTPYRQCRYNRAIGSIPPSTKARWQAHVRIIDQLAKVLPVTDVVVEDIKARTKKGQKRWNKSFSPLEVGKAWFETEILKRSLGFYKHPGFDTHNQRLYRGFKKTANKLSEKWETHCVDSHCLAELVYGNLEPVKTMYVLDFIRLNRRELHQGYHHGVRRLYGSTRSEGLNRGTLVTHFKHGLSYVGGCSKGRISLQGKDGNRLCRNARKSDLSILTKQTWRISNSSPD